MNLNLKLSLINPLLFQANSFNPDTETVSTRFASHTLSVANTSNRLCKSTPKCYVGVVVSFHAVTF